MTYELLLCSLLSRGRNGSRILDAADRGGANLLWFSGRKCLLLTHAATLFTIFEPDVRAAGLRRTGRMVTGLIRRELAREHLPEDTFGGLEPDEVASARTADRSVLGCMTTATECQS